MARYLLRCNNMANKKNLGRSAAHVLIGCTFMISAACLPGADEEGSTTSEEQAGASGPLDYQGGDDQFGGGFEPASAPHGGFGGGSCVATRTPVVFVHGNGDEAKNWDFPAATGVDSVYDAFRAAGYNECELFGITWLSPSERAAPQYNYHSRATAEMIQDFIFDVLDYTGATQVDVVSHSLGVTIALHAFEEGDTWPLLRRFISISGGMHGLTACLAAGNANPLAPTCGSQNVFNADVFGFYPHSWASWSPRMGDGGFRDEPGRRSASFYSLRAGFHDQVLCSTAGYTVGCADSALFDSSANVRAQLDVGHGSTAASIDYDLSDWTIFNAGGGDIDGVGHFRAKNNTGAIQVNMLTSECAGADCCAGYDAVCE